MTEALFDRVAIIGLGLIGSSIARAMRRAGVANSIIGIDRSDDVCQRATALGFVDQATPDAVSGVADADFIVLCTPVGAFAQVVEQIAPQLKPGTILSDAGSVKKVMVDAALHSLPSTVHLVPAHPVAGTENSGPEAGFAELFDGRWSILTPPEGTDPAAVEAVAAFWLALGARVEIMTPERHDLVLAITSHIPHLIAYNIVGTAADLEAVTQGEVIKFSAGGFRDFTRIAASDPEMWRDIFVANKDAVLEMLGRFSEDLSALQRAIRWSDGDALEELFSRTREIRKGVIEAGQD